MLLQIVQAIPPATRAAQVAAPLVDNHGRPVTYLRLSVTDRCNLRCSYCMPQEGIEYVPRSEILSWEEAARLVRICARLGVRKVRVTGGEPFVRRGLLPFLRTLRTIEDLDTVAITTNGVGVAPRVDELAAIGVDAVNLSLDTLDRDRFRDIARADALDAVLATLDALLATPIRVKVNTVVAPGRNDDEIPALAALARERSLDVRFIETMDFVAGAATHTGWTADQILARLRDACPGITPLPETGATARLYTVPGFAGRIGIIAGHSREFCATCNRLRLTARGALQNCLYGDGVLDLKALVRGGADDDEIAAALVDVVAHRQRDGFEAHARRLTLRGASMSAIGG
jgi:molybdenum cofactor biosynthesis protein A